MNTTRLYEMLADHRIYHDDVQIDRFILATPGRRPWGVYKQGLRELYRRWRGLKELYLERERASLRLRRLRSRSWLPIRRGNRTLTIAAIELSLEDLERNICDTEREFRRIYAWCDELKQRIGPLTPERRAELERDQWEYELTIRARLDAVTLGGISRATLESICALPATVADRIIEQAKRQREDDAVLPVGPDPRAIVDVGSDDEMWDNPSIAAQDIPRLAT